jgi:hypothetical protein
MYFYLYRDNFVIKMGQGDERLQAKLKSQGYELLSSPLPTREEAVIAQQMWQEQINHRRVQGLF